MNQLDLKHFTLSEFDCQHTGNNDMNSDFLSLLDQLREECAFPFVITSGYRDKTHPIEEAKPQPGVHSQGIAADIACSDPFLRYVLVQRALEMGFTGIGVHRSFVHVDTRNDEPRMWTYVIH